MADIEVKESKIPAATVPDDDAGKNKAAEKKKTDGSRDTFVSKLAKKLIPQKEIIETPEGQEIPEFEDKFGSYNSANGSLHEQIVVEDKFGAEDPLSPEEIRRQEAERAEEIRREKADRAKEILDRRVINPITDAQRRLFEPANIAVSKTNEAVNSFSSRVTDITDKLAAIIGEREKDIRERLSNTYMKMEIQVYDLMEKIDTSLDQKDHSRENKGKAPEKPIQEEESKRVDNKSA